MARVFVTKFLILALSSILVLSINVKGQNDSTGFTKINTGNSLDLSYKVLDDNGDEIAFEPCMLPAFPGGYDSLKSYLQETLFYPKSALEDSVQGTVINQFTIDSKGNVKDVMVIKGVRNDLDSACFYALSRMPSWFPEKYGNYTTVSVKFLLPIKFIIKEGKD